MRIEDTRKRYGDAEKTGPLGVSLKFNVIKNGIKFYFLEQAHIVVPGLAGTTSLMFGPCPC